MAKINRTNWVGVGVMFSYGAMTIGSNMPWWKKTHWGWGVGMWLTCALLAWLVYRKEKRG